MIYYRFIWKHKLMQGLINYNPVTRGLFHQRTLQLFTLHLLLCSISRVQSFFVSRLQDEVLAV